MGQVKYSDSLSVQEELTTILSGNVDLAEVSRESPPRFGPGELPAEYIPLNYKTLKSGDQFGPLSFTISSISHKHHLDYINRCNPRLTDRDSPYLCAFEFWPLPRVMSQWYFGRLNEVISIRAERVVRMCPQADEMLVGETTTQSVSNRNGLCFGFFRSILKNETGQLCLLAEDVLLLANGCDQAKLLQAVNSAIKNRVYTAVDDPSMILGSWNLQMRYPWPENIWLNNIHTDVYAAQLGYEHGLVEGPGVADVVLSYDRINRSVTESFRLSWKYAGPLYHNTEVALVSGSQAESRIRQYYVCEFPRRIPGKCRILVTVEVEYL